MPISRTFDDTAIARAARDREFARGLLVEATSVLGSEPEVAAVLIGHYIDGAANIGRLAAAMGLSESDARAAMLSPETAAFASFMRGLSSLCASEGLVLEVSCVALGGRRDRKRRF